MNDTYWDDIKKFNTMYQLERCDKPRHVSSDELRNFHSMLIEEMTEMQPILRKINNGDDSLSVAVELADWLGDLVVYCSTFADQVGIDLGAVLSIIMQSNFSKLDHQGEPIYDRRGEVLKGPNFWGPEQKIRELLIHKLNTK